METMQNQGMKEMGIIVSASVPLSTLSPVASTCDPSPWQQSVIGTTARLQQQDQTSPCAHLLSGPPVTPAKHVDVCQTRSREASWWRQGSCLLLTRQLLAGGIHGSSSHLVSMRATRTGIAYTRSFLPCTGTIASVVAQALYWCMANCNCSPPQSR